MSQLKKDQLFHIDVRRLSSSELAQKFASALRRDYSDSSSAIKLIAQLTNSNMRAVKNWYQARNMPSSRHLLLLATVSPSVRKLVLMQIGGEGLWDIFRLLSNAAESTEHGFNFGTNFSSIPARFVPLNVPLTVLNERQKWFLIILRNNHLACAKDIENHFRVTIKTAKRDIKMLKAARKIRFIGSKKSGHYEIIDE